MTIADGGGGRTLAIETTGAGVSVALAGAALAMVALAAVFPTRRLFETFVDAALARRGFEPR